MNPLVLEPDEAVPGRPFTAVENSVEDVKTLYRLVDDLRGVIEAADAGMGEVMPYQKMAWRVDGMTHRLLITDLSHLRSRKMLCVVGFFGDLNREHDPSPLEEANTEVVSEFGEYPGILSYSSLELENEDWANLVLHKDPIDRDYWRRSKRHIQAVEELSPVHYNTVRIHNAELVGGLAPDATIRLLTTKYYDYTGEDQWRAERVLAQSSMM